MAIKISHSRVELYDACGAKYYFQYVEKLSPDKTFSSLLFGSAIDEALNYVLERTRDKKRVKVTYAKAVFKRKMREWRGQNEFAFFKSEYPGEEPTGDSVADQRASWNHLFDLGQRMIDTYVAEVLPLFSEVVDVQIKKEVVNAEGDILTFVVDFIAKLKETGETILFDNKTAAKPYPKNAVVKSQQLSIYSELTCIKKCGYVVMEKKLKKGEVAWRMLVDEIADDQREIAMDKVDAALVGIKEEIFPMNQKNCFMFNRPCDYMGVCKRGDYTGLIKK